MRTVINIKSGGKDASFGHDPFSRSAFGPARSWAWLEAIPTCLLAGILIKVGLDIIDWGFYFGPIAFQNGSADRTGSF